MIPEFKPIGLRSRAVVEFKIMGRNHFKSPSVSYKIYYRPPSPLPPPPSPLPPLQCCINAGCCLKCEKFVCFGPNIAYCMDKVCIPELNFERGEGVGGRGEGKSALPNPGNSQGHVWRFIPLFFPWIAPFSIIVWRDNEIFWGGNGTVWEKPTINASFLERGGVRFLGWEDGGREKCSSHRNQTPYKSVLF